MSDEGDAYVADSVNSTIVKIAAGNAATIAGVAGKQGFVPGPLPGVLDSVRGLAVSGTNLYLTTANGVAVIRNRP